MARTSKSEHQGGLYKQKVQRMPEGYYSGDKPNPNLRAFVEAHQRERPYDPQTDDYDVPAFDRPIETTKATAIYNMHTYWSKKPHDAIRQYVRHYTEEGDLVLDPFCGSGGTALAALMEGRKAVAIDRSPAATFITKNYCTPVEVEELEAAFEELQAKVRGEIEWLYETRCDRCDGKATTGYTVYSQVFRCGRCMERVTLFDCVELDSETAKGKPKKVSACPLCYKRGQTEEISTRSEKLGAIPVLVSYLCVSGCKPARGVRQHNDEDGRKQEYFEKYDLGKLQEIEGQEIPHWYPRHKMMNVEDDSKPWGVEWREGRNFRSIDALYTKRNLWALAVVRRKLEEIAPPESAAAASAMWTAITTVSLTGSRMLREEKRAIQAGTYYTPAIFREIKILNGIEYNLFQLIKAEKELGTLLNTEAQITISTQSARDLSNILSSSVDYIFTDPPYANKVQYGELNFVWEAWLDFDTQWHEEEIIVNEIRGRTESDWGEMMRKAMTECFRVLKPGRWLSLCYHDTSEGTWSLVQDIMAGAGFVADTFGSTLFIDAGQKSYNQQTADKVNKRDLVINFRKPKAGEVAPHVSFTGEEDESTFNEKVHAIVSEYLSSHPGSTKDRIYDEVVSRMVRAGRMEPHNFDELLAQIADGVSESARKNLFEAADPDLFGTHQITRWYLKEQGGTAEISERRTEEAAADRIEQFLVAESKKQVQKTQPKLEGLQRREREIHQTLAALQPDDPERKHSRLRRELREAERQLGKLEADRAEWQEHALHYTYIQEFYFTINPRPQKTLFDLLEDYFFMTEEGNWRPARSEAEREQKAGERQQSIRHTIQRFCRLLSSNESVPSGARPSSTTLSEWIRYCKRSGLYAQGKLLFEKGGLNLDDLPEEAVAGVEEDYQVCARQLARATGAGDAKSRAGRGRKSESGR